MKKNGILTLLFACIPGAGQMYQGYMKRGLSLITMFCLFIIVGSATGLDALVVGCIVVYMYSFFDTFNLRARSSRRMLRQTTIWCTSTGKTSGCRTS